MANVLGKVQGAVSSGLDRVAGALGHKPVSDLDIYKKLKETGFTGMVEKYGQIKTLAYIQSMEDVLNQKESTNG